MKIQNKGFTLLEMIVSLGVFSVAVLISTSSLLALTNAQKKALAISSTEDNIRFAIELMTKEIRTGDLFYCGQTFNDIQQNPVPRDCPAGGESLTFKNAAGVVVAYQVADKKINRSVAGGPLLPLTSSDVTIQKLTFYVLGSVSGDSLHSRITVAINGTAGSGSTFSTLDLETTVNQRKVERNLASLPPPPPPSPPPAIPPPPLADCTGGIIRHSGGKTIHTFSSNGILNCTGTGDRLVEYLVVGGGAGGGGENGGAGGGGAGGFRTGTGFSITALAYSVTVGGGGIGGAGGTGGVPGTDGNPGTAGNASIFSTITSAGGGAGGGSSTAGGAGGSGGGGGGGYQTGGGAGTAGQGNNGGSGNADGNPRYGGGGGGGAGAVGANGSTNGIGGAGGAGIASSISGSLVTYAGGGGGGGRGAAGAGGAGGGGSGSITTNGTAAAGTANTGGGGGGAGGGVGTNTGGAGGSGIVIISYPAP